MKKTILFATLMIAAITVFSQRLERDYTDEFTGAAYKFTNREIIVKNPDETINFLAGKAIDKHTFYCLSVQYSYSTGKLLMVSTDNKLMLKKMTGDIISLSPGIRAYSEYQRGDDRLLTVMYMLTQDDYDQLTSGLVTKIRMNTTDGFLEWDINWDKQDLIKKALQLVK